MGEKIFPDRQVQCSAAFCGHGVHRGLDRGRIVGRAVTADGGARRHIFILFTTD